MADHEAKCQAVMVSADGMDDTEFMRAALDLAKRMFRGCGLCGCTEGLTLGVFEPGQPRLWGARPGQMLAVPFLACGPCQAAPGFAERMEAELWRRRVTAAGAPATD